MSQANPPARQWLMVECSEGTARSNPGDVMVIDITPPVAPVLGIDPAGLVTLTELEICATWQYSLDGGQTWQDGSDDTFQLPDGDYVAGAIQVRQTDFTGNTGAAAANTAVVSIDHSPATPGLAVDPDSLATSTGLEPGANRQCSADDSATWQQGKGYRFPLPGGDCGAGDIQVRQTDAVDITPPDAPTVDIAANDRVTGLDDGSNWHTALMVALSGRMAVTAVSNWLRAATPRALFRCGRRMLPAMLVKQRVTRWHFSPLLLNLIK